MLGDLRVLDTGDELLLDMERVALQALFDVIRHGLVGCDAPSCTSARSQTRPALAASARRAGVAARRRRPSRARQRARRDRRRARVR